MAQRTLQQVPAVNPHFTLQNEGTIYLLTPLTDSAKQWVTDNLSLEGSNQLYPDAVVVEHRYIRDIVIGIQSDGLAVL